MTAGRAPWCSGAHSYTYTVSSDRKTLTIVDGIITTAYTRN